MSKKDEEEELDPRETPLHPRHHSSLQGHKVAERHLLEAFKSNRFHHAWLITGQQGIGKATLAYRLAKFLLKYPDPASAPSGSLDVPADDHVAAQVNARSHPDMFVLERACENGKLKTGISVDNSRKATSFFGKTAAAGGWRVAIVDAAHDMNNASANSLLKTLEEPPHNSVFILVNHQRGRLLPTIRSRCIELPLSPLTLDDTISVLEGLPDRLGKSAVRHASLAGGRPGLALSLAETGAGAVFERFVGAAEAGRLDMSARVSIANALYGRGTDDKFSVFCSLLDSWIGAAASSAMRSASSSEKGLALAKAHSSIGHFIRETNALNLDRRLTMLQAFDLIDQAQRA